MKFQRFQKFEEYAESFSILIDDTNNVQEYVEAVRDSINIMLKHMIVIEVNGRRYEKVDIDHYEDTFSEEIVHNFTIADILVSAMARGKEVRVLDSEDGRVSF